MTEAEFEQALNAMTDEQFREFKGDFGGDHSRQGYVNEFRRRPAEWEPQLSRMLGITSEVERQDEMTRTGLRLAKIQADAAVKATEISAEANRIARQSNAVAIVAAVVSGIALLVSIIALVNGKD